MIEETIRQEIMKRIRDAEREHGVEVLYAVESGSRAWGFESPNSDYDVRFIYKHPQDWYLAVDLEDKRDVIEYEIVDEIDINGWDLRKALRLFGKSNPAFVEWLQSPVVYVDRFGFADKARQILPEIYSVTRGIHHYRSMAIGNYRQHLDKESVILKKYFYVLRALFSILWLEKFQQPAPIEFDKLRELIAENRQISDIIEDLLKRKRVSSEKEHGEPIHELNEYVDVELKRLESFNDRCTKKSPANLLNGLFRECLAR